MLAVDEIAPERPRRRAKLLGRVTPRIAPPLPAIGRLSEYKEAAEQLGITLLGWQVIAGRYMTATRMVRNVELWRFSEVPIVVSRQNGKTTCVLPRITMELKRGGRTLHTAQDARLPRLTFEELCDRIQDEPELRKLVARHGIRTANGTESIKFITGGRYTLLSPTKGVRGHTGDLIVQDEVREQLDDRMKRRMGPTTIASPNPQKIYLSNAGDELSVVLNELRRRGMSETEDRLAYLEWSAEEHRPIDDREGWAEANPALNHGIVPLTTLDLEEAFAEQSPAGFETEHLCRWVVSMQPKLVAEGAWMACRLPLESLRRTFMGISCDAEGRASAAIAWQQSDGTIGLRVIADVTGSPLDIERFGEDLRQLAKTLGVSTVAFDDWTDKELAKYFKTAKPMTGKDYANASANFVRLVDSGKVHWDDADSITEDLMWTARKRTGPGEWMAVKAKPDRPVTAVLAAIRAVGLASGPLPAVARVM